MLVIGLSCLHVLNLGEYLMFYYTNVGSPFVFDITTKPDASKVRVSGPGVEHGILATFQSHFQLDTLGAGAGELALKIRGPKGLCFILV